MLHTYMQKFSAGGPTGFHVYKHIYKERSSYLPEGKLDYKTRQEGSLEESWLPWEMEECE